MIGIAMVLALNLASGIWVVRLIDKDPANLRKRRPPAPEKPPET